MCFQPRLEVLPADQRELWPKLNRVPRDFTLYGGTALALRLGHRVSVDFDFFSSTTFVEKELLRLVPWLAEGQVAQRSENTLTLQFSTRNSLRVSFFGGLPLGRVGHPETDPQNTVLVASLADLAATKAAVITQRAASRDYVDLAAILRSGLDLGYILGCAKAVYRNEFDPILGLKALSYFGDLPDLPGEIVEFLRSAAAQAVQIPEVQLASPRITLGSESA
jgi:hypothetical protein